MLHPIREQKRGTAASEAKKHMAILRNDHRVVVFEPNSLPQTLSTYIALLTLLTLCCTWLTVSKPRTTPTNSNAHVGSMVIEMRT